MIPRTSVFPAKNIKIARSVSKVGRFAGARSVKDILLPLLCVFLGFEFVVGDYVVLDQGDLGRLSTKHFDVCSDISPVQVCLEGSRNLSGKRGVCSNALPTTNINKHG